jgi:glucose-1-phosphate adenylyltransferase
VTIGRGAIVKNAVIDKNCIIPDNMTIGVNREEDEKRFHVSAKGIVLVTPDMLGQEIHRIR